MILYHWKTSNIAFETVPVSRLFHRSRRYLTTTTARASVYSDIDVQYLLIAIVLTPDGSRKLNIYT
jgi:hypothetical protein